MKKHWVYYWHLHHITGCYRVKQMQIHIFLKNSSLGWAVYLSSNCLHYSIVVVIDRNIRLVACQHEHDWAIMSSRAFDLHDNFSLENYCTMMNCMHVITKLITSLHSMVFYSHNAVDNIFVWSIFKSLTDFGMVNGIWIVCSLQTWWFEGA